MSAQLGDLLDGQNGSSPELTATASASVAEVLEGINSVRLPPAVRVVAQLFG